MPAVRRRGARERGGGAAQHTCPPHPLSVVGYANSLPWFIITWCSSPPPPHDNPPVRFDPPDLVGSPGVQAVDPPLALSQLGERFGRELIVVAVTPDPRRIRLRGGTGDAGAGGRRA